MFSIPNNNDKSFPSFNMTIHRRIAKDSPTVTKIEGDIDLTNEIGSGTFGKVYKTTFNGRAYALKKFTYSDDLLHLTTVREIKALRSIQSEYVLSIAQIIIWRYEIILVFPFYDSDLYRMIGKENFTLIDIKDIFRQILKGAQAIHNAGYIHRDLKTANILVNKYQESYKACICDFGMARIRNPEMTPNMVTLWYRAPEILLGSTKYTKSSDVWSLGCILLEFLNKKPLFKANNEVDVLDMIVNLCGSITEEVYPECSRLTYFDRYVLKTDSKRSLYETFSKMSKEGADLADRMLEIDPDKRITIEECLRHDFIVK